MKIENIKKIIDKLFQAGEQWVGNTNQNDDITLIAFRMTK